MSFSTYISEDLQNNQSLMNVFDSNNFWLHTKLNYVLGTDPTRFDEKRLYTFVTKLNSAFGNANSSVKAFIDTHFKEALFDFCVRNSMAPSFGFQNGSSFDSNNVNHVNQLKNYTTSILFSTKYTIDFSVLETVETQLNNLPSELFKFGASLQKFDVAFDVEEFKRQFITYLMTHLYPVMYFTHVQTQKNACNNFTCKRAFNLATYVFVYFTYMTIFNSIYESSSSIQRFKDANTLDNTAISGLKDLMVLLMDGILGLIEDENILDVSGTGSIKSTLSQYYNKAKKLSSSNVATSNLVNEKRDTALVMQNNLTNYTDNEALTYAELRRTRVSFYVTLVVLFSVITFLIGLVWSRQFMFLYVASVVTLLAMSLKGLISAIRQIKK